MVVSTFGSIESSRDKFTQPHNSFAGIHHITIRVISYLNINLKGNTCQLTNRKLLLKTAYSELMDSRIDPLIPELHHAGGGIFSKTSHHDTYPAISPSQFDLKGRTVIITGASRGIGRAMARSFTEAGVTGLCIIARSDLSDTVSEIQHAAKKAGVTEPKVLPMNVDITSQTCVEKAAADFQKTFPDGLDILVNNAGVLEPELVIHESDPSTYWNSFEVNLKGPYLTCRSFLPLLMSKKEGLGIIANITSIGAHMVFPGMSAYNTSKLALCRFTEHLDAEYRDKGITAFAVHPGGVPTSMGLQLPLDKQGMLTDTAELCADSVVWMTARTRSYLSGTYISVQWDMPQLDARADEIEKKQLLRVKLDC